MAKTLNPTTEISQNGFNAPIGANDENVFLYDDQGNYVGTLHDLYENWEDFKARNNFIFTGSQDPSSVNQIKVWYKTYN